MPYQPGEEKMMRQTETSVAIHAGCCGQVGGSLDFCFRIFFFRIHSFDTSSTMHHGKELREISFPETTGKALRIGNEMRS